MIRVRRALWLFVGLPLLILGGLIVGVSLILVVGASLEEAYYAVRPQRCYLAAYLPPEGVPTRCEMSGFIDYEDIFEARVSKAGAEAFQNALMKDLKNPRPIDGEGINVRIKADGGVIVGFSWDNGFLTVDYYKY